MKTWKAFQALLLAYAFLISTFAPPLFAQQGTAASYVAGDRVVSQYNFGKGTVPGAFITNGNTGTGSQTITICPAFQKLPDGRSVNILGGQAGLATVPITVDAQSSSNSETVTPTAVSLTGPQQVQGSNQAMPCANVTASFSFTHAPSQNTHQVISGDGGLQEAMNDAFLAGGGSVVVPADSTITTAILTAAIPYQGVTVVDKRLADVQYWRPTQSVNTALATPAVLTGQAACDATHFVCSDASVTGTWTAVANFMCISYVDVMGNEGTCSPTNNFTTVVSKAVDIGFSAAHTGPASSTGAVGYTIYVGPAYATATQVPITPSVCKMTAIETATPACAVTNATYNQTGSDAVVAAITVNTSPLALLATTTSSTTDYIGNPNAVTIYKLAPSNRVGLNGILGSSWGFPVGAAAATTVPNVIGTLAIPPGYMNYAGRAIRISGYATEASAGSTSTITTMQLWWDAAGSDTATGVPILIATIPVTNTLVTANTDQYTFSFDIRTTVAGASATAGTIIQDNGFFCDQYTTSSVATVPKCVLNQGGAAVGSLNLAGGGGFTTRIHVVYLHTTGTDGAGVQLQNLTVQELN